jgi:hypothetical protein
MRRYYLVLSIACLQNLQSLPAEENYLHEASYHLHACVIITTAALLYRKTVVENRREMEQKALRMSLFLLAELGAFDLFIVFKDKWFKNA